MNFLNITSLLLKFLIDYLGPEFFLGNEATDCMEDELVTTESDCRYAAHVLKKDYMKDSKDPYYDRPAGCYYRAMSDDFHFNTILDPSATNKLPYSTKGVCVKSMY